MNGKPWWASKTIWINLIAVVATLLAVTVGFEMDATFQAEIVAVVMGIVNIVLRFVTVEPVNNGS